MLKRVGIVQMRTKTGYVNIFCKKKYKILRHLFSGSALKDRRYQRIGVDRIKIHESSRLSLKMTYQL